jgi:flagellar assembly protein FliH
MQKYRGSEIKSFEFSDLQGAHVVTKGDFKPFAFGELTGEAMNETKVDDATLRSERSFEKNNNFKIDGAVRASRGIAKQEQSDFEKSITEEVNRRLEAAYADAYNEGLEKGRAEGKAEAFAQHQEELSHKVENFVEVINGMQAQNGKLMEQNKAEVYEFIKRFTKWICLKEINEKLYLETLLEKLVLELNARKNLIVKVGRENFTQMPEVIAVVESRLGQLQNIRIEIVPEINHPGIILESENGLIDGSIEGVFANIDKIFESVLKHE